MKKRRSQLIKDYWTKSDLENYKNTIGFQWSDVQGENEKHIAKANFIENLQNQTNEENLPKK